MEMPSTSKYVPGMSLSYEQELDEVDRTALNGQRNIQNNNNEILTNSKGQPLSKNVPNKSHKKKGLIGNNNATAFSKNEFRGNEELANDIEQTMTESNNSMKEELKHEIILTPRRKGSLDEKDEPVERTKIDTKPPSDNLLSSSNTNCKDLTSSDENLKDSSTSKKTVNFTENSTTCITSPKHEENESQANCSNVIALYNPFKRRSKSTPKVDTFGLKRGTREKYLMLTEEQRCYYRDKILALRRASKPRYTPANRILMPTIRFVEMFIRVAFLLTLCQIFHIITNEEEYLQTITEFYA